MHTCTTRAQFYVHHSSEQLWDAPARSRLLVSPCLLPSPLLASCVTPPRSGCTEQTATAPLSQKKKPVDGEDEATKEEAAAPVGDDDDEALDFSKKKKKVRPSPLPAPPACTHRCLRAA